MEVCSSILHHPHTKNGSQHMDTSAYDLGFLICIVFYGHVFITCSKLRRFLKLSQVISFFLAWQSDGKTHHYYDL